MKLKRRGFFAGLFGLAAAPVVAKHVPEIVSIKKHQITAGGEVRITDVSDARTWQGFVRGTKVLLNGRDVSMRCYRAERYSDGTGAVWCHVLNDKGKPYSLNGYGVAEEKLCGLVEIIRPCPPGPYLNAGLTPPNRQNHLL